jgi:hypothetical protein
MAMIDSVEVMARFGHRYPTLSEAHGLLNCLSESKVKSDALRSRIERSIERIESLNDEFK